jgi:hypothetical protein
VAVIDDPDDANRIHGVSFQLDLHTRLAVDGVPHELHDGANGIVLVRYTCHEVICDLKDKLFHVGSLPRRTCSRGLYG